MATIGICIAENNCWVPVSVGIFLYWWNTSVFMTVSKSQKCDVSHVVIVVHGQ